MVPAPPAVPESDLEARGWTRVDDRSETVFEGLGVSVESRTLVYEDEALRRRITEAGGPDRIWQFLFVSRLEMTPPPAFGAHAAVRPHVLKESKRAFATELLEHGIERIETGETKRIELAGDRQARLTSYRGVIPVESATSNGAETVERESGAENGDGTGDRKKRDNKNENRSGIDCEVNIVGRLALWYDDGFVIAGCVGPNGSIGGALDVDTDGESLLSLIRTVA